MLRGELPNVPLAGRTNTLVSSATEPGVPSYSTWFTLALLVWLQG